MRPTPLLMLMAAFATCASTASAKAPDLKTPSPVIYLADNLDEVDQLGWCIDTVGRGFAERLHAHSCKPQGGDVQFSYDEETKQIKSVAFDGKCMSLGAPFGLLDCSDDPSQKFTFEGGRFSPVSDPTQCVSVGEASRSAGPFLSRDLTMLECDGGDPTLMTWVVQN